MIQLDKNNLYEHVPKDLEKNLIWRHKVLEAARYDQGLRNELWSACSEDILFWINTFIWTYDPRYHEAGVKIERVRPFITYPFQDDMTLTIVEAIGRNDNLTEKSRDQGATWDHLAIIKHLQTFSPMSTMLVVADKQEKVDDSSRTDTLFSKLDMIHDSMPAWMRPRRKRKNNEDYNILNSSVINGTATTEDIARGGRYLLIFIDEYGAFGEKESFAMLFATQSATRCRLFNSTPHGQGNGLYKIAHKPSKIPKIELDWFDHPIQKLGLYRGTDHGLELIDTDFWDLAKIKHLRRIAWLVMQDITDVNPEGPAKDVYPFISDGQLRSPYFDNECDRSGGLQALIDQELRRKYLGAGTGIASEEEIADIVRRFGMPAILKGRMNILSPDVKDFNFEPYTDGDVQLWFRPDLHNHVPLGRQYAAGIDIGLGTGASDSAAIFGDLSVREVVAVLISNKIPSYAFAQYTLAMAYWLNNAFLIWERNGEGRTFGQAVIDLGYRNFYYQRNEDRMSRKVSDIPGWWNSTTIKRGVVVDALKAMGRGVFVNRCIPCIQEFGRYIWKGEGIEHANAIAMEFEGENKANHGDSAIGASLLWHVMKTRGIVKTKPPVVTYECFGNRQKARTMQRKELEDKYIYLQDE